jgi:hypothetical protein
VHVEQHLHPVPVTHDPSQALVGDLVGQPDVQVQTEWRGDLLGEVSADGPLLWVGASDQLGLIPAQRDRVVPVPVTWRPCRLLRADCGGDRVGVGQRRHRHRRVDRAQPGLVGEQRAYGDVVLPVDGELRPVRSHRHVVLEQPPRMSVSDGERRQALRR